jgi:protein TonB
VTPPRFLGDADHPPYPERSRQLGEQGRVVLKVKVGVDGQVLDVVLLRSSGYPQLDASAMQWLRQGPFIPARRGQQAIVSWWNTGVVYNVSSAQ